MQILKRFAAALSAGLMLAVPVMAASCPLPHGQAVWQTFFLRANQHGHTLQCHVVISDPQMLARFQAKVPVTRGHILYYSSKTDKGSIAYGDYRCGHVRGNAVSRWQNINTLMHALKRAAGSKKWTAGKAGHAGDGKTEYGTYYRRGDKTPRTAKHFTFVLDKDCNLITAYPTP